ncbi:MAG: hypothetical protein ABI645_10715 [Pseudomonadota bacterium]
MSKCVAEVFTSAFVLPEHVAAARDSVSRSTDGLGRLDDLMVVLEGLGGSIPPRPESAPWLIVRL